MFAGCLRLSACRTQLVFACASSVLWHFCMCTFDEEPGSFCNHESSESESAKPSCFGETEAMQLASSPHNNSTMFSSATAAPARRALVSDRGVLIAIYACALGSILWSAVEQKLEDTNPSKTHVRQLPETGLPIGCNGSLCLVDGPCRTVSWRRYRVDCAMQLHIRWPEFVNGTSRRWNCPDRMHSTYGENASKSNPHLRSHHP